jgi:hypothetical protein
MARSRDVGMRDILERMERAEEDFLGTEFLAPVMPGGIVRVRIEGIVCSLRVAGGTAPGWAILRPTSMDQARIVRTPSPAQVRAYLALFPPVRLVLVVAEAAGGSTWIAIPAHRGDRRIRIDRRARVHLVRDSQPFETIVARFDGSHFWFEAKDRRRSPALAQYLREALRAQVAPQAVHKRNLSAEEREAYGLSWAALEEARKGRVQLRLEVALAHAGAEFSSFVERGDAYTVRYTVDGREHVSTVRKDDLTVLSAGICLAGEDERFDLESLVGVLRQSHRGGWGDG